MMRPTKTTSWNKPPALASASLVGRCLRQGGRVFILPQPANRNPRRGRVICAGTSHNPAILCDAGWTRLSSEWNLRCIGGFHSCPSSHTAAAVTRSGNGCFRFRFAYAAARLVVIGWHAQAGRGLGDSGAQCRPSPSAPSTCGSARSGGKRRHSPTDPRPASAGPAVSPARFLLPARLPYRPRAVANLAAPAGIFKAG